MPTPLSLTCNTTPLLPDSNTTGALRAWDHSAALAASFSATSHTSHLE